MQTWNVYVHRDKTIHIGTVHEQSESLARCAALSKFGMSEDEYFEQEATTEYPLGITAFDDFSVSRA